MPGRANNSMVQNKKPRYITRLFIGMQSAKSSLDNTYYFGNVITPVAMELEGL